MDTRKLLGDKDNQEHDHNRLNQKGSEESEPEAGFLNPDFEYSPFQNPPDLSLAEVHRKATRIGRMPTLREEIKVCPCCDNVVNKSPHPLCCDPEEFLGLGLGYPLFFILYKYFAAILVFVLVISGGGFYFLVSIDCRENCFKFFGVPIMSNDISLEQSMHKTEFFHIVTAAFILGSVIVVKHFLHSDLQKLQRNFVCPSQYTVMIQNLPKNIEIAELRTWVKENLSANPISINVSYNTSKIIESVQSRQDLRIQENTLKIKLKNTINQQSQKMKILNKLEKVNRQIQEKEEAIRQYNDHTFKLEKTGTVFVTFQRAQEVERILDSHEKTFVNLILQKISIPFASRLLRFQGRDVVIFRAPAPKEVIWQNLEFSYARHVLFELFFLLGMAGFILLTFRVQFEFVRFMYGLRHEGQRTGNREIIVQALAMSGIIVGLNMLLRICIEALTRVKKSYSYSKQQSTFCSYYSTVFVINSCLTIYIVHGEALQGANHLLLYDIHTIMLTNAFSEPLFKLFDPAMWLRVYQRFRVQKLAPHGNPYTQSYVNRLWEGHQISNADNYQFIIRVLVISVWFANVAPLGVLFGLLGMGLDFWIVKFLFTRVYKQPKSLSREITKTLNFLELLPLVYILGIVPFLYKVTLTLDLSVFLRDLFHYGVISVVVLLCILGYLCKFRPKEKVVNHKLYAQVELGFGFNYETENPLTKLSGEKKFLEQALKKGALRDTEELAKNLIRRDSLIEFEKSKKKVNQLKLNLLRKISSSMNYEDFSEAIELRNLTGKALHTQKASESREFEFES